MLSVINDIIGQVIPAYEFDLLTISHRAIMQNIVMTKCKIKFKSLITLPAIATEEANS